MTEGSTYQFECGAKYLGSMDALYPKVGTLENAARLYQKGCFNIKCKAVSTVKISAESITVQEGVHAETFNIRKTLFCATYKKIPKVVVFNYLDCDGPYENIQCHALFLSSFAEAQNFVRAVTAAFSKAYSNEEKQQSEEAPVEDPVVPIEKYKLKRHSLLTDKITDILGVLTHCVSKEERPKLVYRS